MLPASGQNLYTNEPEVVYPILEQFIAENFQNQVRSFEFINRIDSINVVYLQYPLYGKHIRHGANHTITVHKWLLNSPKRFERTLKHELGHVFGLDHIPVNKMNCVEIMSSQHWEEVGHYYADPEIWKRINHNYYKSLKIRK
jgi:predicted Zn-dependent protease